MLNRTCERCGNRFHAYPSQIKRNGAKYCSLACIQEPLEQRFWSRVNKNGPLPARAELGPCWTWTGGRFGAGYGAIRLPGGESTGAHIVAYELGSGASIPPGLFVCHHCDNRMCCRFSHLFLGTLADNSNDMKVKGRAAKGEAHGHAKLTDKQVRELRHLRSSGVKLTELAHRFGIGLTCVKTTLQGRYYSHVT